MVESRIGLYGEYYGSPYDSSAALTEAQMQVNALYIYNSMSASGWTLNSICGILGNMEVESSLNPGRWQGDVVEPADPTGVGYGLVQWTPYTNYTDWALNNGFTDPSVMDGNIARINYELENNLQWIPTYTYPMSFGTFKESTLDPYNLAMIFLANYERPLDPYQPVRGQNATKWYNYLRQYVEPTRKKSGFKWVLYANKLRNHLTF